MTIRAIRRFVAAIIAWLAIAASANGQVATVCTNCGNEFTQILNNVELLAQTAKQASILAEGVQQTITQINQYAAMVKNLQQMPLGIIGVALSPYKDQVSDLSKLYSASVSLSNSATQAQGLINSNLQSSAAMSMTPSQYTQYVIQQAQGQGGVYRQMLSDSNAKLQNLQVTSKAFQDTAATIPDIQGGKDGIQTVATLAAASGQVATEMLADQKTALAITLQNKADDAASAAAAAALRQREDELRRAATQQFRQGLRQQ